MIRRVIFLGLGVTILGLFVFGRHASSYVRTATGWVSDSVKQAVPIEFEIDRARGMVKDIMPEIRKNMQTIAKEEVEVERLNQDISNLEKKQDKDRTELMSLRTEASSGKTTFRFAGHNYTLDQVKCDLANRFDRFKTSDATLASLNEILTARQKSLDAARQKLDAMLVQKRQLEADVENLEARLKVVEVAQTSSNYLLRRQPPGPGEGTDRRSANADFRRRENGQCREHHPGRNPRVPAIDRQHRRSRDRVFRRPQQVDRNGQRRGSDEVTKFDQCAGSTNAVRSTGSAGESYSTVSGGSSASGRCRGCNVRARWTLYPVLSGPIRLT